MKTYHVAQSTSEVCASDLVNEILKFYLPVTCELICLQKSMTTTHAGNGDYEVHGVLLPSYC